MSISLCGLQVIDSFTEIQTELVFSSLLGIRRRCRSGRRSRSPTLLLRPANWGSEYPSSFSLYRRRIFWLSQKANARAQRVVLL